MNTFLGKVGSSIYTASLLTRVGVNLAPPTPPHDIQEWGRGIAHTASCCRARTDAQLLPWLLTPEKWKGNESALASFCLSDTS